MRDQLRREPIDDVPAISLVRFDDLSQRRAAERAQSQKAGAECGARLALQACRVAMRKGEGARHGPFTGLRRLIENERIRRIEPDGAQQLHRRGPPVVGSSQDGMSSAGSNFRRVRSPVAPNTTQSKMATGMIFGIRVLLVDDRCDESARGDVASAASLLRHKAVNAPLRAPPVLANWC